MSGPQSDEDDFEDDVDELDDDDAEDDDAEEDDFENDDDGDRRSAKPRIETERARAYSKAFRQLQTFYNEIRLISNKKPDGPLNKFKLALINETLERANFVLGEEDLPFPGFRTFDESNMPSASDVVLMISHYRDALIALRGKYSMHGHWRVVEGGTYNGEDE